MYYYWATLLQSNTRPWDIQTVKVQVPCWAMPGPLFLLSLPLCLTPCLSLSLSLPPWWLMANAALVHLYIPPHPSLANHCEILDMAWIWPPGEKRGIELDWWRGQFPPPTASISSVFFFFIFKSLFQHIFTLLLFFHRDLGQSGGVETLSSSLQSPGTIQLYYSLWHL